MNIIEFIKTNPDYTKLTKSELETKIAEAYAELELQKSANNNNKIKINAGYGILSNKRCRWKKHVNAEAITSCGQLCVRGVANYITKTNTETAIRNLYVDTDSCFIVYDNKKSEIGSLPNYEEQIAYIENLNKTLVQPKIDEYYDGLAWMFNAVANKIKMDFELISDKSIFLAPKKYVMRKLYDNGKHIDPAKNIFKVRGVEIVRTTTPMFFRKKLEESMIYFFNRENYDFIDFVNQTKKEFFELPFEDMANPSGVNNMEKYQLGQKGIPLHVFGSLVYNDWVTRNGLTDHYQLISDKTKIKFSYIKKPNSLNAHVISVPNGIMPPELLKLITLDYEHQFEKNFVKPTKRFMDVIGWVNKKSYEWDEIF